MQKQEIGARFARVNMLAPPRARLSVEVVLDLVCPWCRLGTNRLMRTLQARPDLSCEISWRAFLLNPDMPRAGVGARDYMVRKFGSEERARRLYHSLTELGRAEGMTFRFDRIQRTPSSVDAHRLVRWAAGFGRAAPMVEALFSAYFHDGRDIGDSAVLTELAEAAGLDAAAVHAFLLGDAGVDAVHADNLRAHRLGITGVPCFVVADRHAIAGAQEPEVIERLLDVAAVEAMESLGFDAG